MSSAGRVDYISDYRTTLLSTVAKELEFSVQSMCTSANFYKLRTKDKIRNVKDLKNPEVWDKKAQLDEDLEDARDITKVIIRLCAQQKGKGRKHA